MASRDVQVVLVADPRRFTEGLARATVAARRLSAALWLRENFEALRAAVHHVRHHTPEDPARSRMHAAYDRRRRARRRRR